MNMSSKAKSMGLENRKQNVASFPKFILRVGRYGFFAGMLIFISVGLGSLVYRYLGNLSWIDSFYMACMILTGMGPVREMLSTNAKLFSSLYALYSGVAFLSIRPFFCSNNSSPFAYPSCRK